MTVEEKDRERELRERRLLNLRDLTELVKLTERREREELHARNLARFLPGSLTLVLNWLERPDADLATGCGYEIDLERITSAASLVSWIFHLREKNWFTPQMLSDFLDVFEQGFCKNVGGDPRSVTTWVWKKTDKSI